MKSDGSLSIHSESGFKPLNWMSPPCVLSEAPGVWRVTNKGGEQLVITLEEVLHDTSHELGIDPGLIKDGVEAHLQVLLAERCHVLGEDMALVRREYPTDIGPVDLMCRDAGGYVAVEIKRRGEIDGVEQLTRYLSRLAHDPAVQPVRGILAAQQIAPQAKVLAQARGIGVCVPGLRRAPRPRGHDADPLLSSLLTMWVAEREPTSRRTHDLWSERGLELALRHPIWRSERVER